jgi:hypothetical protein
MLSIYTTKKPIILGFIFFYSQKPDAIVALGDPLPRGYFEKKSPAG